MKNIVNSFRINTLSSRKGLGVGLTCLFLTLGVGQMWGAYYITGSNGNLTGWGTWNNMTESSDGIFWYFQAASGNCECKINTSKNYTNALDASSRDGGFCDTDLGGNTWDAGGNINYWYNSGSYYILVYKPNTAVNTTNKAKVCASTFLPDAGYETTGNTMTYYSNKAASDQTTSALDRTNGSTTALGTVTTLYLKGFNSKMWQHGSGNIYGESKQHYYYKVHRTAVAAGSTGFTDAKNATSWSAGTWTWGSFNDSKYRYPTYSGSLNENLLSGLGSGNYTMSYYYLQEGSKNFRHPSDGSKFNKLTWTIGVPSVSGGAVTSNGTGTGADGSPFSVADGNTITFTASGSQASTDANSVLYVKWGSDSYAPASSTTKTITPTTTKQSMTVKLKYYNSNDDLSGAETTLTIYYQSTLTPSIGISSISPSPANSGDEVTITASRQNAGTANITYQYSLNGTSGWTTIGSATSSTTKTWTVPAITATTTYYFRAQMTYSATTYTSDVVSLKAYGKKTIKVKDTNSWGANFKIHRWGGDAEGTEWPGETANITTVAGQWKQVVLYSSSTNFVFCNGSSTSTADGNKTADQAYASMTDGNCYQIQSGSGASLTLTSTDCPTAPSVTTASATSVATTSVQFNASSVSANNDAITAYGFKWGTTDACSSGTVSASNLGAGTTFSASKTGLTNGTTYYYKAYATNGFGTTYGSVQSFRTKYVTTVTLDKQGGSEGTSEVTANEGSAMPSGKTAPGKTGYTFGGYYANAGGSGTKYYNANMGSAHTWDVAASTATIHAKWTANTYTITYNANGGTGTTANSSHTYDVAKALTSNGYSRTGYTFGGWATSKANADAGTVAYTNGQSVTNLSSTQGATVTLWAIWTPKSCTVKFNFDKSDEGYGSETGATTSVTATYGSAMTTVTPPTAKNGYAFMGYWDGADGSGTQYYKADGTSKRTWNKDTESATTLYAYYKKAEIVNLDINPSLTEKGGTVKVTPEIEPEPTGTTSVCYYLLYTNGNKVDPQPDFSNPNGDNTVNFTAPSSAGTFIVAAALRTGSSCGGGTLLDSVATHTFQVGGEYSITVKYMRDNVTIKPQTKVAASPSVWTEITAPDIIGYSFSKWKAGDGVTIEGAASGESTSPTINFQASYDGTLTALYTKKRFIYFNNTNTNWSSVNVYFYKNDSYWDNAKGTGSDPMYTYTNTPYGEKLHGAMTRIEGTNVWYFDCEAAGVPDTYKDVAFTEAGQNGYGFFSYKFGTTPNNVSRRGDFNNTLPMFVPISQDGVSLNNGQAKYSNEGYWMNYPENTGYSIRLFSKISGDGTYEVDSIPVEFTEDYTLAEPINVLMDAGHTYGFKLFRADDVWMGNTGTMTNGASGDEGQTAWEFRQKNDDNSDKPNCGLTTTAAGTYTFSVSFGKKGGNYDYFVGVHYPVVAKDFQILYKDNATWSQGSAHTSSWLHPSRMITARANGVDTISFFVSKGDGISASLKARKVNSIDAGSGAITWGDLNIASAASMSLTVDSAAVYNFKVTQSSTAGTIASIENIGAYTGDYYIRCNAMNNKWGNFRDDYDHLMTYSAFSEDRSQNGFGDLFSHYKAKWCPRSTNVKFCIANDYSLCISDTLIRDITKSWPENMDATGTLYSEGGISDVTADKWSANIRFMWNRKTNKISRAYVASATNTTRKFLVLRGCDTKIHDHNDYAIPATDYLGANEILLEDDENWIYETTIKAKPTARVKLYACYGENPASVQNAQYFRGAYDSNNCGSDANSIQILGGSGESYYLMRVIYDFKTNRLITAWLPDGTPVDQAPLNIDADVMVIRDHQQAAEAITFTNSTKSLGNVKTVYGTIRFNRWTLNNRYRSSDTYNPSFVPSTTETDVDKEHSKNAEAISRYHAPLPTYLQTSSFERNNYFISFPFDVQLSEVFGFGTYGTHWIISKYNGLRRAQVGYFRDNCINGDFDCTNWDYIWDRTGVTLKAYEGYLLSLDLDLMQYDDTTNFWLNQIHQVELYFPSKVPMGQITTTNVTLPGLTDEYLCTKNYNTDGTNPEGDRRVKDSYWRCIGVPSYAPYGTVLKTGETEIQWNSDYTWYEDQRSFPFLYEWNTTDNTLTPQRTKTFNFKPLHSYLVQNKNTITWTAVSATPAAPVAARMHDEDIKELTWRLTLTGNADDESDTYIRMTNDEDVTPGFDFGPDLIKKFRDGYILDAKGDPIWDSSIDDYKQGVLHSDIYSLIGYEYLAANSLPLNTTSNTIVPIGVRTKVAGDFTFAMPDGTHGVGITLVDQVNGIRTNLSTGLSYTTALEKGQFDKRFYLEISPVKETPTGLEQLPTTNDQSPIKKLLIDGILYIIRDGKIFDARGVMVK